MRCKEVASQATEFSEGALWPWQRFFVRKHLEGCADCRTYVAQLELTGRALRTLEHPALASDQKAQAMAAFKAFVPSPIAVPMGAPAFGKLVGLTLGFGVLGVLFARQRLDGAHTTSWIIAACGLALACGLMWLARSRGGLSTTLSIGGALAFAAFAESDVGLPMGVSCALHELGTGALALTALMALRRGAALSGSTASGVAAAGALASDAALHLTCAGASSVGHVLVFHVGGVAAAAAIAGTLAAKMLVSPARAT